MFYIYIIETEKNFFYTGWTLDIKRRWNEHISGKKGAKYTRINKVRKIAVCWKFETGSQSDALKIEHKIKQLTRNEKENLVHNPHSIKAILSEASYKFTILSIKDF